MSKIAIEFQSTRHIDKIQLSIKDRYRRNLMDSLASKSQTIQSFYIEDDDRMITAYKSGSLNAQVCEYHAKKRTNSHEKTWCSVRLFDPTKEAQSIFIADILRNIPASERFVKCIEYALDIYPLDPTPLRAMHQFIAKHLTLKNSQSSLVGVEQNSFTFNPKKRKNIQVITYLNPKDDTPQSLRIELRLYREHLARRYPKYALFDSPIEEFVSPLSSSYVIFRDPIIENPFPMKRREFTNESILRQKLSLGLKLSRADDIQKEKFVQDQVYIFRHMAKSIGVKHRDINRYFPKRLDILQQLKDGRLHLEENSLPSSIAP